MGPLNDFTVDELRELRVALARWINVIKGREKVLAHQYEEPSEDMLAQAVQITKLQMKIDRMLGIDV